MKCPSYNDFFEVISPKLRIRIIETLQKTPMCVSDLCKELNEEQSKISHNLKKLYECHFLTVKQDGKKRVYSLNEETITPLLSLVEKHVKHLPSFFYLFYYLEIRS
jgi:ArsR family transcriptional regulator